MHLSHCGGCCVVAHGCWVQIKVQINEANVYKMGNKDYVGFFRNPSLMHLYKANVLNIPLLNQFEAFAIIGEKLNFEPLKLAQKIKNYMQINWVSHAKRHAIKLHHRHQWFITYTLIPHSPRSIRYRAARCQRPFPASSVFNSSSCLSPYLATFDDHIYMDTLRRIKTCLMRCTISQKQTLDATLKSSEYFYFFFNTFVNSTN